MTWRAIWQSGSGAVRPDGAAIPPRLFRGTLLAEVDLARLDGNGDPLLQAAVPGASLSLGLKADGRVHGRVSQDGQTGAAACRVGAEAAHGLLRLSWQWDGFNRMSRLTSEHLDAGALRQTETDTAAALGRDLVAALFIGRAGFRHPGLLGMALCDQVLPVATPPGLLPATRILTPKGPRPAAELRAGDLVSTADAGPQPLIWSDGLVLPALGSDRPVRLLAPFFGQGADLVIHSRHRVLVSGPEVEYLFGRDEVLVEARHLVDGRTAVWAGAGVLTRYHGLALERHHLLIADGARVESHFLGRIGADPALAATTLCRDLVGQGGMPIQRSVRRQLGALEAAMLVQARARRCAPLAA